VEQGYHQAATNAQGRRSQGGVPYNQAIIYEVRPCVIVTLAETLFRHFGLKHCHTPLPVCGVPVRWDLLDLWIGRTRLHLNLLLFVQMIVKTFGGQHGSVPVQDK
jgi:hypothetical protein